MKKIGLNAVGIAVCLALAVALGWSALPTNAAGQSCAMKSAGAKSGTCNASKAAALSTNASGAHTCSKKAREARKAKEAAAKTAKHDGAAKPALQLAADGTGECPAAKAAKAGASGCCPSKDAKQAAAKDGACSAGEGACKDKDIATLVAGDTRFTTLALAVKAAGMSGEFLCPNPKTVLAPTNDAFQKIPAEQWAAILQDDAKLKALVANHIIKGAALESCALKDAKTAKSAGGSDLNVSACPQSGQVSVNNAKVVGDALVASNGIVHAIDTVLLPADAQVAKADTAAPAQVAAAE